MDCHLPNMQISILKEFGIRYRCFETLQEILKELQEKRIHGDQLIFQHKQGYLIVPLGAERPLHGYLNQNSINPKTVWYALAYG